MLILIVVHLCYIKVKLGTLMLRIFSNRESSGSVMVEAAIILPIFLTITFWIIEITTIFFFSFILENAMYEATRAAKVAVDRTAIEQRVRDIVQDESYGLFSLDKLDFQQEVVMGNSQSTPAENCATEGVCPCADGDFIDSNANGVCDTEFRSTAFGGPGDTTSFTAIYTKTIVTPLLSDILGVDKDNTIRLVSTTVLRNEP